MEKLRKLKNQFTLSHSPTKDPFLVTVAKNRAFNAIPEKIFDYLEPLDLLQCRLVHTSWKVILDNPNFWLKLLRKKGMLEPDIQTWKLILNESKNEDSIQTEFKLCLMKLAIDDLKISLYKLKFRNSSFSLKIKSENKISGNANPILIALLNKNVVWMNTMMKHSKSRNTALNCLGHSINVTNFISPQGLQGQDIWGVGWLTLLDVLLEASFDKKCRGNDTIEAIAPILGEIPKAICHTWSPIERAVMCNNFRGVKLLAGTADDTSLKDALRHAIICKKRMKICVYLIQHFSMRGLSIDFIFQNAVPWLPQGMRLFPKRYGFFFDMHEGFTPMTAAAERGLLEIVETLAEISEDPNATDAFRFTPIARATFAGRFKTARLLLSYDDKNA